MIFDYNFRVAGFILCLHAAEAIDIRSMLPSFEPFLCDDDCPPDGKLLDLTLLPSGETLPDVPLRLVDVAASGIGTMRLFSTPDGNYRLRMGRATGGPVHEMESTPDFSTSRATVCMDDAQAGHVIGLMLRMAFAQAVLLNGGVLIHASAVHVGGKAYLFMGKSGTGKSTHASLWQRAVAGCELLNDDSPAIRIVDGRAVAYGTPWSGKTPCYKNLAFPIGGMARLRQASSDRFIKREGVDAFVALYPGCSVVNSDRRLYDGLCDTLARLAGLVTVGTLECRPDTDAALLCFSELSNKES